MKPSLFSPPSLCRGAILAMLCIAAMGCARYRAARPVPPYANLISILADFRQFSQVDLYRHPFPRDPAGLNFARATLERLADYERIHPNDSNDIIQFTRAEAYARLADFIRSAEAYQAVPNDSPLAPKAAEEAARMRRLAEILDPGPATARLDDYLEFLQKCREMLIELESEWDALHAASLVRRERERIEIEYAMFLFRNRFVLPEAAPRALEQVEQLIAEHHSSRLIQSHHLMLGQFAFELLHDQVLFTPPDRTGFDTALFYRLAAIARENLARVALADGYPERLEASALLNALEAFTARIRKEADHPLDPALMTAQP